MSNILTSDTGLIFYLRDRHSSIQKPYLVKPFNNGNLKFYSTLEDQELHQMLEDFRFYKNQFLEGEEIAPQSSLSSKGTRPPLKRLEFTEELVAKIRTIAELVKGSANIEYPRNRLYGENLQSLIYLMGGADDESCRRIMQVFVEEIRRSPQDSSSSICKG